MTIELPGWICLACHAFHGMAKGSGKPHEGGKVPHDKCRICGAERQATDLTRIGRGELLVIVGKLIRELGQAYENLTAAQASGTKAALERQDWRAKYEELLAKQPFDRFKP